jgi:hypothetical protein
MIMNKTNVAENMENVVEVAPIPLDVVEPSKEKKVKSAKKSAAKAKVTPALDLQSIIQQAVEAGVKAALEVQAAQQKAVVVAPMVTHQADPNRSRSPSAGQFARQEQLKANAAGVDRAVSCRVYKTAYNQALVVEGLPPRYPDVPNEIHKFQ